MCGIAGIVDYSGNRPDEDILKRMLGLIRHRGPDAFGIYTDPVAGIASTRLSIIDIAGGNQPIHNEDRSLWIVYNGEIYNFPELAEGLEKRGHHFYTRSDTEVLVHLYEDYGPGMLSKLNGQFAVAIWNTKDKTFFLARDRLGVRPLFYSIKNGHFVFGSEIKALFADPCVERTIDPETLSDIFTCWAMLHDKTPFSGIKQLPPGTYATLNKEGIKVHQYWRLDYPRSDEYAHQPDDFVEELEALLVDACRIRLRADVPVGAYLSGGLDSTYITSIVKKNFNNKICTFSVSFTDKKFDEGVFQESAVNALGTDHRMIRCTDGDIGQVFPEVVWHAESPLLRTAPAPLFLLSKLVHDNNYKVVLTGEGADELFAGYDIFKEDQIRRFWARQPSSKLRPKLLERLYPDIFGGGDSRAGSFLVNFFKKGLLQTDLSYYAHMIRWENTSAIKTFFSKELAQENNGIDSFISRYESMLPDDYFNWDPLSRAQYTEAVIFLSNYLLSSQGDRMAMGHAVEGRFPFLDHRVVELACRVPPKYRLNGFKDKFILREAASRQLPREIAYRRKHPYRAPISACFFGDHRNVYVEEMLSERSIKQKGYFNPGKVKNLIDKIKKQQGKLLSERENMALIGILSTQLVDHYFVSNDPSDNAVIPETVKIYH